MPKKKIPKRVLTTANKPKTQRQRKSQQKKVSRKAPKLPKEKTIGASDRAKDIKERETVLNKFYSSKSRINKNGTPIVNKKDFQLLKHIIEAKINPNDPGSPGKVIEKYISKSSDMLAERIRKKMVSDGTKFIKPRRTQLLNGKALPDAVSNGYMVEIKNVEKFSPDETLTQTMLNWKNYKNRKNISKILLANFYNNRMYRGKLSKTYTKNTN